MHTCLSHGLLEGELGFPVLFRNRIVSLDDYRADRIVAKVQNKAVSQINGHSGDRQADQDAQLRHEIDQDDDFQKAGRKSTGLPAISKNELGARGRLGGKPAKRLNQIWPLAFVPRAEDQSTIDRPGWYRHMLVLFLLAKALGFQSCNG